MDSISVAPKARFHAGQPRKTTGGRLVTRFGGVAALLLSAAVGGATPPAARGGDPQQTYAAFSRFCGETFGAEREPLIYERFGRELALIESGGWRHVSTASACLAWETNLPARSWVEFGEAGAWDSRSEPTERHFYLHVHYLRDLQPGTDYQCRLAATDERGNRLVSPAVRFTTLPAEAVTPLPGGLAGPPFVLDRPGHYVLTQDIAAEGTALEIASGDVTLDLGGRTVTYNNAPMGPIEGDLWQWFERSAVGVRVAKRRLAGVRIVNGVIRQGAGGDGGQQNGVGFHPIASHSDGVGEIAGVTIDYYGTQIRGMKLQYSPGYEVHHNMVIDRGTEVTNRHQGIAAIEGTANTHHNLVLRARHRGIDGISESRIWNNEVYCDSCATNAYGLMLHGRRKAAVHGNRIFGTGYMVIGIGTVSKGVEEIEVYDNLVHLQAVAPMTRFAEYGPQSGAHAYRLTWGGRDIEVRDNLLVANARDGGTARGVWVSPEPEITGVAFRRNVIKMIAGDEATSGRGAISICGPGDGGPHAPILFEDNVVISNFRHVLLGESYGCGMNAQFVRNRFVRSGPERDDYQTIQTGFWTRPTGGHRFVDSTFAGGADYARVQFVGTAERRDFAVEWTLTVDTVPRAEVIVTDRHGATVASGRADAEGRFAAPLVEYVHHAEGPDRRTPHRVTVRTPPREWTATVEMTGPQQICLGDW